MAKKKPTCYSIEHIELAQEYAYQGTGGSIQYAWHENITELLGYLDTLATMLCEGGTIRGNHKKAEFVAVAIDHQGKHRLAFDIFKAIVSNTSPSKILFVRNKLNIYASETFSPVKGKLGYGGVFRFACLALKYKEDELAKTLFLQIVEKTPDECFPISLQDTRLESIRHLKGLGVKTLHSGLSIDAVLKKAENNTY